MIRIFELWPHIVYVAACSIFLSRLRAHFDRKKGQKTRGCQSVSRYPQWDIVLGSDVTFSMAKALKNHGFLIWLRELHAKARAKTFTFNFLGTTVIHAIEPENMKALSAVVWKDFGIEPLRRLNKASMPFADKGVNTTDGVTAHMYT